MVIKKKQRASTFEQEATLVGIAHDLCTPLTRLRLSTEMIADSQLRQQMYIDLEYLEWLLKHFVASITGKSSTIPQTINIHQLLNHLSQPYQRQGMIIHWRRCRNLPTIIASTPTLSRIITNLLDNAQQHAQSPINIDTAHDQDSISITISDYGPGLTPTRLRKLQSCQPLAANDHRRYRAHGIGLRIVKQMLDELHGSLSLNHNPHGGLSATVKLCKQPQAVTANNNHNHLRQ